MYAILSQCQLARAGRSNGRLRLPGFKPIEKGCAMTDSIRSNGGAAGDIDAAWDLAGLGQETKVQGRDQRRWELSPASVMETGRDEPGLEDEDELEELDVLDDEAEEETIEEEAFDIDDEDKLDADEAEDEAEVEDEIIDADAVEIEDSDDGLVGPDGEDDEDDEEDEDDDDDDDEDDDDEL